MSEGVSSNVVVDLKREIEQVAARAGSVDVRKFEEGPSALVESELVPAINALVSDATGILTRVLAHYETSGGDTTLSVDGDGNDGAHFYEGIEALMKGSAGAARISDLAFMARWELERKRAAIDALEPGDAWKAIAECGSARRRLIKSATAVELALAEHEGLASSLASSYVTELKRSIETRRVYALFRNHLRTAGPYSPESPAGCLRAAGTAIATIVGRDIYEDLRVSDRIELRKLQQRVLQWLRGDDGFDPESGRRLWQDLEACSDLLLQVNHRAELCEHDGVLAGELLSALREFAPSASPSKEIQVRARLLLGRDGALDQIIERSTKTCAVDWIPHLERLRLHLRQDLGTPNGSDARVETLAGGFAKP